jgi:hypothetical protein
MQELIIAVLRYNCGTKLRYAAKLIKPVFNFFTGAFRILVVAIMAKGAIVKY